MKKEALFPLVKLHRFKHRYLDRIPTEIISKKQRKTNKNLGKRLLHANIKN